MKDLLLGIDIGTSACKVALFSADGTVIAQNSGEYNVLYPQSGWAEQNPEDWWNAVCRATKEMLAKSAVGSKSISGIGIAGQSWSAIPTDKNGEVLCNTPIWMDTRAVDICGELDEKIGADNIFKLCGNPLQPAYTLPKILWYKKHRRDVYDKTDKILQSNSYIAFRLTGAVTQDLSQCYGLQCFDMQNARWDESMCAEMGLRRDLLPEIVPCRQIVGHVTAKAAAQCGLTPGIPVVAGGLDAACGTLGAGVINDGETQEQGGQAGGMSICMDGYRAHKKLILGYHVVPDRWLLQGGTVGGGGIMRWLESEFAAAERETATRNGTNSMYEMDCLAAKISAGADGLIFLPYMAGERSPVWDANAKGVFYGLDYAKTRAHMYRAGLESVAYSLRHNLETAVEAGANVKRLRAMGGAANSRLWTQIKCDVTGKPIDVPSSDTATTLGAAILAGVATGIYKSFDEAVAKTVRVTRTHEPGTQNSAAYDAAYSTYLAIYDGLKGLMNQ